MGIMVPDFESLVRTVSIRGNIPMPTSLKGLQRSSAWGPLRSITPRPTTTRGGLGLRGLGV